MQTMQQFVIPSAGNSILRLQFHQDEDTNHIHADALQSKTETARLAWNELEMLKAA